MTARYLNPVRPAPLIEGAYRKRLLKLLDELERSALYWVRAAYRAHPPALAQDEVPAAALQTSVRRLATRWLRRFDRAARDLARYFTTAVAQRTDTALRRALERGGLSVKFKTTATMRDALAASVNENVALIRSIPQQLLSAIEGHVMRSVAEGRDLGYLTERLQQQFGVTRRRAAFIARDQNNKATATVQRVRYQEAGVTQAVWVHSTAGKEPRPSHLKAGRDRVVFDVSKGWWDPDEREWIWPGTLINCRCVARPVVPGFS